MPDTPLRGLKVLSFESRRAAEICQMVASYGGQPLSAPSMREIPLSENEQVRDFFERLSNATIDIVVLLTGVGTKALVEVLLPRCSPEQLAALLRRTTLVARGPKPRAALRQLGIDPTYTVAEPNTWRELLELLRGSCGPLAGKVVAIQEYGRSNTELIDALSALGATVLAVPVYRWALPEDLEPLRAGIRAIAAGEVDVVLFTSAQQCNHMLQIAAELGIEDSLRAALSSTVVASVGPIASEALRAERLPVDIEPVKPKMGPLLREVAQRAPALARQKRTVGQLDR
jgi:uroporphyrinogen-III synthase